MSKEKKARIEKLRSLISYHRSRYHDEDAPEITDEAFDSLVRELTELEGSTDETVGSEVNVVGGSVSEAFNKVQHKVRQWSFGNVFNRHELIEWKDRLYRFLDTTPEETDITLVAEHKIDGLKVILTYKKGKLIQAATRGDGVIGEDVTHTVLTIKDVPHKLTEDLDLICVGEVWLSQREFGRVNVDRANKGEDLFANPRNAAAGSLRQLDPEITRSRNLSTFVYDIEYVAGVTRPITQGEELQLLDKLGFNVNPHWRVCKDIDEIESYYKKWSKKHDALGYGVDGVVLKVNEISIQKSLGHTAKSPRYGVAYKFPAVQATTMVEDIQLQVGRTGVVTPVAHLRPVLIDGSTVSRATLHNEDQIEKLDVRIGDTIILQKAGDVIPEVVSVVMELRPKSTKPYRFPKRAEGCGGDGSIARMPGEAAYRCVTLDSDHLQKQRLYHFVSKGAFNIDGIGPRIIDLLLDKGLVTRHYDLFTLTEGDFLNLPNFKEQAARNTVTAIAKARIVTLDKLLVSLSIDGVGEETARVLADRFGSLENICRASAEELSTVYGIGGVVGEALYEWLNQPQNKENLNKLLLYIEVLGTESMTEATLTGLTLVFTGTLPTLGRDEAKDLARAHGAKVSSSVSRQTDFVVVGTDAGSKAEKALEIGVKTISEAEFLAMTKT
ncbi:DNA ligase (NAD(+)) LigA [bacterium]|nr:DNA ligase (NAD(+)) LigA [bacterium]